MVVLLLAGCVLPQPVEAQRAQSRFAADTSQPATPRVVRTGKWVTLAVAAGAVGYGISWNRAADRRYDELERLCKDQPARCARVTPNGAFRDAALEREYQDILELDDRARIALAAGQIAIAASVVLFVLDLPRGTAAADKPYTPPRLQLIPAGGGRLALRFSSPIAPSRPR